jgi:hypothetical protein
VLQAASAAVSNGERRGPGADSTDAKPQPAEDAEPGTAKPKTAKPQDSASAELIRKGIVLEYVYGILGLVLGLAAIIGGVVLGINGVAGSTSWTAKLFSLESQINDAAPGVVLFIVGLFMIIATKPKVRLRDLKG